MYIYMCVYIYMYICIYVYMYIYNKRVMKLIDPTLYLNVYGRHFQLYHSLFVSLPYFVNFDIAPKGVLSFNKNV